MSSIPTVGHKAPLSGAYRTVWRWHFYAGVVVMPFLLLLTLTGGLYLFKDEIDRFSDRHRLPVAIEAPQVSPDQWLTASTSLAEGRAATVLIPASQAEAVQVRLDLPGRPRSRCS